MRVLFKEKYHVTSRLRICQQIDSYSAPMQVKAGFDGSNYNFPKANKRFTRENSNDL